MASLEDMAENAESACRLLKALANKDRLMILCNLAEGERSVSDLEEILQIRQPSLSQQLARLRQNDLVETRRDGKAIYYSFQSDQAGRVIDLLYELFCATDQPIANAAKAKIEALVPA